MMENDSINQPKEEKAQGMVEFALVLPLLLLLVLGIIEAGRMLFLYSAVLTSSREAARYGSAAGDIGGFVAHYEDCTGIRAAAKRMGRLAGIGDANISISYDHGPGTNPPFATCPISADQEVNLGDRVIVQVGATYRPLIPMVRFSSFPISSVTRRTIIKNVAIEGTPPSPITPTVSFVLSEQSHAEGVGDILVAVQLTAGTSKTVIVPFTVDGTATLGVDYTITSSPVVFSPGDTIVNIVIHVTQDEIYEENELIVLTMGSPTNAIKGSPNVHRVTILNDDAPPTVFFASSSQSQAEDVDTLITVKLSAASYQDITVSFTVSGTASGGGVDYIITSSPIVIPAGDSSFPIVVDVNDDVIDEDDETVIVTMGAVINATKALPDQHVLTITDNDAPPLVSFTWESQIGDETVGSMTVQVKLSAASSKQITVPFSVGGSATRGTDYTIDSTPLVIPPGGLTASTAINVIADSDNTEGEETVVLTLLTPTNATIGSPSIHTATIATVPVIPVVFFSSSLQSGYEDAGQMVITAVLSAASSQNVTVPFSVSGTATRVSDYTITSSPVVIPAGGSSVNIVVTLIDDTLDEFDETVVVTMGTPINATKGTPSVHTATILDNDGPPVVFFTTTSQSAVEAASSLLARVGVTGVSDKPITVPFNLSGTATLSSDYTISASPVIIPAGSTSVDIIVDIIDDTLVEVSETIIITLGTPTNATLGSPAVHTITIVDNEPVCPSPDSLPFFGTGSNRNKLTWTLQSPNPLISVNLVAVTIRWPSGSAANVTAITFGSPLYSGNALPPYLAVTTPSPIWSGAFATRQMIFKFDRNPKSVSGDFYQVTATFEGCPPISGIIPSN